RAGDARAFGEALLGAIAVATFAMAVAGGEVLIAIYSTVFAVGFLTIATMTTVEFVEVITLRSLGMRTLKRLREMAPVAGLLVVAAGLLLAAAQTPQPFEDGYAHWLLAANLAATGGLHDPLFGMEDTWLPGYHVLAAGLLWLF